jgi:ankyrin repeat protein
VEVLGALAAYGFNMAAETLHKDTLLHMAAQYGHAQAVSFLLQYVADANVQNYDQLSALDLAREGKHHQVVAILQQHAGVQGMYAYQQPAAERGGVAT